MGVATARRAGLRLLSASAIVWAAVVWSAAASGRGGSDSLRQFSVSPAGMIRILAVGDINLGRIVGQEILSGDTLYPFQCVRDTLLEYDMVFGNLESQLSDQGGETQDPNNNLVFTGPPAGARALRLGGVTVVSTANNHALDYGVGALKETLSNLREARVLCAGTGLEAARLYTPVRVDVGGIRIALFACTDFMNRPGNRWRRTVAAADTARMLPAIRAARNSADFIIVSYHGGDEYADRAARRTRSFAHAVIRGGADLFLGHHPHVPYGIEEEQGKLMAYSLGNFVFYQPGKFWTGHSFALDLLIAKDSLGTRVASYRCVPVRAGLQPEFLSGGDEARQTLDRIRSQSSATLWEH